MWIKRRFESFSSCPYLPDYIMLSERVLRLLMRWNWIPCIVVMFALYSLQRPNNAAAIYKNCIRHVPEQAEPLSPVSDFNCRNGLFPEQLCHIDEAKCKEHTHLYFNSSQRNFLEPRATEGHKKQKLNQILF